MSQPMLIEPDARFKQALIKAGGETLKKCFQCGTCTVACPLSPDKDPFPRKELLWAQWGLKDRLMADPDVWLCHQCNDCAQLCPREANPGDVLATVRQQVVEHYSTPSALARLVNKPAGLLPLFAIPAVLMLLVIAITGGFSTGAEDFHPHFMASGVFVETAEGGKEWREANFDHFFAHYPIIIFFTAFVALSLAGAYLGLRRYWEAMVASGIGGEPKPGAGFAGSALAVFKDILTHGKFKKCEATANRYWGHLLAFYGFAGMFVTTTLAAILYYTAGYPFGLFHPVKMLGNVSGLAFLIGLGLIIVERVKGGKLAPRSGYADWLFIVVIGLTVVTGVICQAFRLSDAPRMAYSTYFIHLLFVFFLLVYLPYSKFAHLLYRTVAMIYSHCCGREEAPVVETAAEAKKEVEEAPAA